MNKPNDDPENPEWTTAEMVSARRGIDHLPAGLRETLREEQARRHRGPQRAPTKVLVSLRLDRDVVDSYKVTGRGWQSRINADLKSAAASSKRITRSTAKSTKTRRVAVTTEVPRVHPGVLERSSATGRLPHRGEGSTPHTMKRHIVRKATKKR